MSPCFFGIFRFSFSRAFNGVRFQLSVAYEKLHWEICMNKKYEDRDILPTRKGEWDRARWFGAIASKKRPRHLFRMDVIYKVNLTLLNTYRYRYCTYCDSSPWTHIEKPKKKKKEWNKINSPARVIPRHPSISSTTDIYRILFQLDAPKKAGVFKSNNFVGGRASSMRRASDII